MQVIACDECGGGSYFDALSHVAMDHDYARINISNMISKF